MIPFFVSATVGTTGLASIDNLAEIGPVCKQYDIWMHVDGAYGGNSFVCPELRGPMKGLEYATSFNVNANKWLLTSYDSSVLWVKDRSKLIRSLLVDPTYLKHKQSDKAIDYRHWGLPLSRRFRALKLWFVMRMYGIEGLQSYIRRHCKLAKKFEALVREDSRFEVVNEVKVQYDIK